MFLGASLLLIHLNPGDIFPNVNSALSLITLFRSNVNIIAYICLGKAFSLLLFRNPNHPQLIRFIFTSNNQHLYVGPFRPKAGNTLHYHPSKPRCNARNNSCFSLLPPNSTAYWAYVIVAHHWLSCCLCWAFDLFYCAARPAHAAGHAKGFNPVESARGYSILFIVLPCEEVGRPNMNS